MSSYIPSAMFCAIWNLGYAHRVPRVSPFRCVTFTRFLGRTSPYFSNQSLVNIWNCLHNSSAVSHCSCNEINATVIAFCTSATISSLNFRSIVFILVSLFLANVPVASASGYAVLVIVTVLRIVPSTAGLMGALNCHP